MSIEPQTPLLFERESLIMANVLVVNDERHMVETIERYLRRDGYEVTTAFNGIEAMEEVERRKPDLIILDSMMPHMDGFEVMKKLGGNSDCLTPRHLAVY